MWLLSPSFIHTAWPLPSAALQWEHIAIRTVGTITHTATLWRGIHLQHHASAGSETYEHVNMQRQRERERGGYKFQKKKDESRMGARGSNGRMKRRTRMRETGTGWWCAILFLHYLYVHTSCHSGCDTTKSKCRENLTLSHTFIFGFNEKLNYVFL